MPAIDGWYWAGMLAAGTLGTVLGDGTSEGLEWGVGLGSLATGPVLACVFALRAQAALAGVAFYWVTVVTVRTAGTTLGDLSAGMMGLEASTLLNGALLLGVLGLWSKSQQRVDQPA